jgi:hypothetical protein
MSTPAYPKYNEYASYHIPIGALPSEHLECPQDRADAKELYKVFTTDTPMTTEEAMYNRRPIHRPVTLWNHVRVNKALVNMPDSDRAILKDKARQMKRFQRIITAQDPPPAEIAAPVMYGLIYLVPVFHINPAPPPAAPARGKPISPRERSAERVATRRWVTQLEALNHSWKESCQAHMRRHNP